MFNNKKLIGFTLAEVMITLIITSVILAATYSIGKHKVDSYDHRYLTYSAYMALKNAVSDMKADGCTAADVTNTVCSATTSTLPSKNYDSTNSRGFCDRLVQYFNVVAGGGCSQTLGTVTATTDFSTLTPNLIASNGIRFYGLGGASSTTLLTVYVDIDGPRGKNLRDTDVVMFYIDKTTGAIFPNTGCIAATSTDYLSTSVYYMSSSGKTYVDQNIPFLQGACEASAGTSTGHIYGFNISPSCTAASYSINSACTTHSCQLEISKPNFFW